MLTELIECPICLNEIENDEGILIPECCKNPVHLQCLMNWYENNTNTNVCFICQQENEFSKDIHYIKKNVEITRTTRHRRNNSENSNHLFTIISIGVIMLITVVGAFFIVFYI